jgi:hypothetical protein
MRQPWRESTRPCSIDSIEQYGVIERFGDARRKYFSFEERTHRHMGEPHSDDPANTCCGNGVCTTRRERASIPLGPRASDAIAGTDRSGVKRRFCRFRRWGLAARKEPGTPVSAVGAPPRHIR